MPGASGSQPPVEGVDHPEGDLVVAVTDNELRLLRGGGLVASALERSREERPLRVPLEEVVAMLATSICPD